MVDVPLGGPPAAAVDWSAPWFAAVAGYGPAVAAARDRRAALGEAADRLGLRNVQGLAIRFAAADAAAARAYEAHIFHTGEVPTRENAHDFFNALVWLALPRTKARLNALQADAIEATGTGARRGPLRDAATLLDENGVLLVTTRTDLIEALRRHDWRELFVAQRAAWRAEVRAVVVGHALMEKLTAPYKAITAHALPVMLGADAPLAAIDASVATALDAALTPRRLLPLPVCGIPGWAENEDPSYYEDASVFRPIRAARTAVGQPPGGRR